MAYSLVSVEYVSPENRIRRVRVANFGRIPIGTLKIINGYLIYRGAIENPGFKFWFKNEHEENFFYDAYEVIKSNMQRKNLNEKRRNQIISVVTKIVAESELYEPETWFIMAVKSLKI